MSDTRPAATATVQLDNARVRVTEWRFAPGAATGWHVHEYDYVVVPMTSGVLKLETPTGDVQADLTAGLAYYREKGVEHDVVNVNETEFVFVETEIKAP
jgi:quercetin dioxygenase-like cupin family protein